MPTDIKDAARRNDIVKAAAALAYNSLVIAWPEIAQLARKAIPVQAQAKELF